MASDNMEDMENMSGKGNITTEDMETSSGKSMESLSRKGSKTSSRKGSKTRRPSPSAELRAEQDCCPAKVHQTPPFYGADQTLIFLDWDDTLFPTSDLFDGWGFQKPEDEVAFKLLTLQQRQDLKAWQSALFAFFREAVCLSKHVVIVTNSARPWVERCIDAFVPDLKEFFDDSKHAPSVVYAREKLNNVTGRVLRPVMHPSSTGDDDDPRSELTRAKFVAMQEIAEQFYSQYKEQTWKNIVSIGDAAYEHDALQEVTFRRVPIHQRENVRTKAILLPYRLSVSEMTLQLRFSRIMLPHVVLYDGDIDLDLDTSEDPLRDIAAALQIPDMLDVPFSKHAWGKGERPSDTDAMKSFRALARTVFKAGHMLPRTERGYV